jgi:hypothetical protein
MVTTPTELVYMEFFDCRLVVLYGLKQVLLLYVHRVLPVAEAVACTKASLSARVIAPNAMMLITRLTVNGAVMWLMVFSP